MARGVLKASPVSAANVAVVVDFVNFAAVATRRGMRVFATGPVVSRAFRFAWRAGGV